MPGVRFKRCTATAIILAESVAPGRASWRETGAHLPPLAKERIVWSEDGSRIAFGVRDDGGSSGAERRFTIAVSWRSPL
ncbi:MAG TPA: hypothetical protein DEA40_09780 [Parvularcula sp.]|nr:hypothetical protein [Parvularcula sp.]